MFNKLQYACEKCQLTEVRKDEGFRAFIELATGDDVPEHDRGDGCEFEEQSPIEACGGYEIITPQTVEISNFTLETDDSAEDRIGIGNQEYSFSFSRGEDY